MAVEHFTNDYNLLQLEENETWLNAIKANDVAKVAAILESLAATDKRRILDGKFEVQNIPEEGKQFACLNCSRSLTFAVIFGARDVIQVLLQHGADPAVKETNGDNIIHVIVRLCELDQDDEMVYVEFYQGLMTILDTTSKQKLLYGENHETLRPLELSAKKGYIQLTKAILTTKEVYMIKEQEKGGVVCQEIDISDYEGPSADRMDKSPLAFIAMMSVSALTHVRVRDTFTWIPFKQWYRLKLTSNWPLVYLWMIARMSMVVVYYVIAYAAQSSAVDGFENTTNSAGRDLKCEFSTNVNVGENAVTGMTYYITISACLILVCDIGEVIYTITKKQPYAFYNYEKPIVTIKFYRQAQHVLAWVFAVVGIMFLSKSQSQGLYKSLNVLYIIVMSASGISVMYFLQIVPIVGHYVMSLHKMIGDLVNFMIFYALIVVPYAFYFLVFFHTNSRQGCVEEFSDMWQSLYTTFTMMLNMVNLRDYDIEDVTVLQIVHINYVFLVGVLLVNFLIAVMSNSASEIASNERLIHRLEKLHIAFVVEFRIRWLFCWYYNYYAKKMGFLKGKRTILNNVQRRKKFVTR